MIKMCWLHQILKWREAKKKLAMMILAMIHCCIRIWLGIVVTDECQEIKVMDEDKNDEKKQGKIKIENMTN